MDIRARAAEHLARLADEIGPRPIASPGNREAAEYIVVVFGSAGLGVELQEFPCPEWEGGGARLVLGGEEMEAAANPFSPSCDVTAPSVSVCTLAELEAAEIEGRIVVLYGDLTRGQLGAKGAIWVSERDRRVIELLEARRPAALITVTPRVAVADGLTEDWQLDIPSATVPARVGLTLLASEGEALRLELRCRQGEARSANVVGRKPGTGRGRVALCAHYDTKFGTPGAHDNGAGVAVLLTLAELLAPEGSGLGLELTAFSAEEYGGLGDMEYLRRGEGALGEVLACINIDGAGQRLGTNTITTLSGSEAFDDHVRRVAAGYCGVVWTEPWFASDHYTFYSRGVPSVAITSTGVADLLHSPADTVEWVSPEKLAEAVRLVAGLVRSLRGKELAWARAGR